MFVYVDNVYDKVVSVVYFIYQTSLVLVICLVSVALTVVTAVAVGKVYKKL